MRTSILLPFLLVLLGCMNNNKSEHLNESKPVYSTSSTGKFLEKVQVDLEKSIVAWKGTKLLGAGSHTGTVKLKSGFLLFSNDLLAGGEIVIDMNTIYNTDIPLDDPVPRKNITRHLHSDFETGTYPTAKFKIMHVKQNENSYEVHGILTIKDIGKKVDLEANQITEGVYTSEFAFDRFDWKIGENGTWLEKKLVDPLIHLKVEIHI